ncbi:hypothetical protein Leryth_020426 [Lithospermum erythrorhizon]|nr:hypothetical protein Leryth_020426 [Lithospermum erythrorhizon]
MIFWTGQVLKQVFHATLKTDSLKQFIPIFNEIAKDHVKNEWKHRQEVKVFPLSKLFCFSLACRFLTGNLDTDEIKTLASLFDEVKSGFFSLPINLPGTTYTIVQSMQGKQCMRGSQRSFKGEGRIFKKVKNGQGLDLLSQMLKIALGDKNQESQCILDLRSVILLGTLLAATSIDCTMVCCAWQVDLKKMEYTWNVVREILWTSQTSHKDPKYFENLEEFNPSRFESSVHEPYSYVPFGGER